MKFTEKTDKNTRAQMFGAQASPLASLSDLLLPLSNNMQNGADHEVSTVVTSAQFGHFY